MSQGGVDDRNKSASFVAVAPARRSTSSLDTHMAVVAPFEDVLEVSEYFDGPRTGVALYLGSPHKFRSLWRDVHGSDDMADVSN